MTGPQPDPLAFLFGPGTAAPQRVDASTKPGTDPLAFLFEDKKAAPPAAPEQNQGFFDYVKNVGANWFKVNAVKEGMNTNGDLSQSGMGGVPFSDPRTDPEIFKIAQTLSTAQQTGGGAGITLSDFGNVFGKMFGNVKDQLKMVLDSPGTAGAQIAHDLPGFLGGIAKAFVTPIGDLAELQTGVQLSGDDVRALTPEEKANRIKNVVATGAMLAVGAGLAKGLGASSVALRASLADGEAASVGTAALTDASRLTAKGAVARELLNKTIVAGGSGAAYGLVRYANESDQLSQTLINGVIFAPLGAAHELLTGRSGIRERMSTARTAGEIAQLRQVQDVLGNSFQGVVNNVESLASADNLAEAVLTGRLKTSGQDIIHIPGVSSEQANRLAINPPEGFSVAQHLDPNGDTGNLLVYSNRYRNVIDPKFFAENGFAQDQIVGYGGRKQWRVTGGNGKLISLENVMNSEESVSVPREDVRPLSNMELDNPLTMIHNEPEVPAGMTRLYRGETADGSGGTVPDWVKQNPDYQDTVNATGRWFNDNKAAAEYYAKTFGTTGGITYVDVPSEKVEAFRASNQPAGKFSAAGRAKEEFFVPPDVAAARKPVSPDIPALKFGPLNKDAVISRMYSEWKGEMLEPQPSALDALLEQRRQLTEQIRASAPEDIAKLTTQSDGLDEQIKRMQAGRDDPMGFDEMPPDGDQALIDRVPAPEVNYSDRIKEFLKGKNFDDSEIPSMQREFEKRLVVEAHGSYLEPEEHALVSKAFADVEKAIVEEGKLSFKRNAMDSARLVQVANSNGMVLVDDGSGHVAVKDIDSNLVLFKSDSYEEVAKFINRSGESTGVALDGGGPLRTEAAAGGRGLPPAAADAAQSDFAYHHAGKSETLIRFLDNFPLITRNREFFTGIDTKYGSELFAKVFDKTQSARRIANAKIRPYYEKLQGIEKVVAKLNSRQREQIGEWMQTMNPEEVISHFMSRKMNPLEESLGRKIAASGIDIQNVFNFRRALEKMHSEFSERGTDPQQLAEYNAGVTEARNAFGIDERHKDMADLFDSIEGMGKSEASLGAIVRLARSIQNNEGSRVEYAAKHKLSFEQIRAANQLEGMYDELAGVFGIGQQQRLGGYMTHARLYGDGNMSQALKLFGGDVKAREFYAKLARTGEISAYETDPIRAMQRYIKGGMDSQHFSDALASAKNDLREEIKKLPGMEQQNVLNVANRYLTDLQGFMGAGESATQASVDNLLAKFKVEADVDVKRQIVNAITAVVPAATQGARIMAGARDFATHMLLYSSRFGYARMARAIILGGKAMAGPMRAELERMGDITVASPIQFADATEQTAGVLRGARGALARGVDRTTKTLFRLSGQQDVYAMMHSGAYLETRETVAPQLLKLSRGETKWQDVVKKISLNTYDQPVVKQFTDMVREGKMDEAARFLSIQTGYEQIGVFGLANQPYMWGSNVGRIVGQYGNWPMWLRSNVTRMMGRGTNGQRIASMTRLAAGSAMIAATGSALGLNLSSWSIPKGLMFAGGPLVDLYETVNDAVQGYGYQQKSAMGKLKKFLPYDPSTGQFNIKQLYLPGSFFVDDIVKSIGDFNRGQTAAGVAQAGGFHPVQTGGGL